MSYVRYEKNTHMSKEMRQLLMNVLTRIVRQHEKNFTYTTIQLNKATSLVCMA